MSRKPETHTKNDWVPIIAVSSVCVVAMLVTMAIVAITNGRTMSTEYGSDGRLKINVNGIETTTKAKNEPP